MVMKYMIPYTPGRHTLDGQKQRIKFRMNIHRWIFFCLLSSALFDGNTDLVDAQTAIYTKMEGEDFRATFDFQVLQGSRKYLCRNDCKKDGVLIETHGNRAQGGRYTIRYDIKDNKVHVVITGLTQADAGRYKVGVSESFTEFDLKVRDLCDGGVVVAEPKVYSSTEGGNVTIKCSLSLHPQNRKFLCRGQCNKLLFDTNDVIATSDKYQIKYESSTLFDVTITALTKSDSGRYRCGVGRTDSKYTCQEFELTVSDVSHPGNILPLVVGVTVLGGVLVISALLLYKWKTRNLNHVHTTENGRNIEYDTHVNHATISQPEGSPYQALDLNTRDQNPYASLQMRPNT